MKKIYTLGLLAALVVIALNACSREDRIIETPVEEQTQGYTLIVNAEKGVATKGLLNPADKKIKAYWKAGEKVYAYQYDYDAGKWEELAVLAADASETGSTTLRGTLKKVPNPGGFKLYLHVPYVDYSQQYGVLNESTPYSIEDNFDYAIANVVDFKVDETARTVTANDVSFSIQQAIVKFNLLDTLGNPIENLGTLEIEDQAEGNYKCMSVKIGPKDGKTDQEELVFDGKVTVDIYRNSSIYVALSHVRSSSKLHLTAKTAKTDSEPYIYTYTYDKTGVVFEDGCYYEINVKMKKAPVDLSQIDAPYTAKNGEVLTGKLGMYKITIADGAKVTLRNADISHFDYPEWSEELMCRYAGLTLEGSATIMLEGTNIVCGFHKNYPGIYIPADQRLAIDSDGDGSLEVRSGGRAAGIGGTYGENVTKAEDNPSGDLSITGGTITAYGGEGAAGIGSSEKNECGYISIDGGTITAYGGKGAAGIGSGYNGICGNMLFWHGSITATGGTNAAGIGSGQSGVCHRIDSTIPLNATSGGEGIPAIGAGLDGECGLIIVPSGGQ